MVVLVLVQNLFTAHWRYRIFLPVHRDGEAKHCCRQGHLGLRYLEQFLADVDEHGTAEPQQAVIAASLVTEQGVPQAHTVREGELLRQQQGYPPESVELRVHLHTPTS